jgi:C-terminal processing protease CtpA/Prc
VNLKANTMVDPAGGYLLTAKQHPGVGEQKPSLNPFTGKLIVLTDGMTFSTSADVAAHLRHLTKAIFVGEETGGGCEGNTSGLNAVINLANSKLSLKIHMYGYWNAVSNCEKARGVQPDFPVEKIILIY